MLHKSFSTRSSCALMYTRTLTSCQYVVTILFSLPFSYYDQMTATMYTATVLLQIRIKPGSYRIVSETVGATSQIDRLFSNDELAWSTDWRESRVIYGVLVKLR